MAHVKLVKLGKNLKRH